MNSLNMFQRNNLLTGNHLAAEIPASTADLRAFVVIGSYVQTRSGPKRPSKSLNAEVGERRFWIRCYEVSRHALEIDADIVDQDLVHAIYRNDIQTIDQLEHELQRYLHDFSQMEVSWKVDNPLP